MKKSHNVHCGHTLGAQEGKEKEKERGEIFGSCWL